jgi:oligoendopeptidase F
MHADALFFALLEILKDAGVDLTGKEAYEVTVNKFRKLLKEYKSLL